ncbi:MAG: ornithine carbamoyltransferase [Myxococcales bacterium]|nr:ornithine carbamoyltransferase [Myxococcales bacterium]
MKRDFLKLSDLGRDALVAIIARAEALKAERRAHRRFGGVLEGRSVALIFEKPSTRTRVSFEVGVRELGGHPVVLSSRDMQLGRGETIEDTARTLSGYVDLIVLRTFGQSRVETLARWASVPVINALTDEHHPCQILADLQTVQARRGSLEGLRAAWVGDGNNVARSWAEAAQILGFSLALASPEGFTLDGAFGPTVRKTTDPREAVKGAEVVITDVFASMGQEAEAKARLAAFEGYQVNPGLLENASKGVTVLHCLPAHRGEEIDAAYLDGDDVAVWDEAENRLHAQKALIEHLMRG